MKKYLRFYCSICQRTADRLIDQTHFTPDKCTITLKCEGRLSPVQYLSDGQITSAPEIGVVDWRARGTSVNTGITSTSTSFLDTSTGSTSQVVLAVRLGSVPTANSVLTVTLNQRVDTPKANKQFVYRQEGTFSTISGVESGLEKKTLRYSFADTVQVMLNGTKLDRGIAPENYQISDGVSAVPPNTIKFNTPVALSGTTQVDVIVFQTSPTTQVSLAFNRNKNDESRLNTGSWENVDAVRIFNGIIWQTFYLFTLDLADTTALKLNALFTATSTSLLNGSTIVQNADMNFVLARKPYSILDRYTSLLVPLSTLTFERDYLKYFVVDGIKVLYVTDTAVSALYPLMQVQKFNIERTIKTALAGIDSQILVDDSVIVGPDA